MPDRLTGKLTSTYRKKLTRLFTTKLKIGFLPADESVYTSIQVFVPVPTDINHVPGVFLTLSNPFGQAFTRLTLEDLDNIIEWLTTHKEQLTAAYDEASLKSKKLKEIERLIYENSQQTLNI